MNDGNAKRTIYLHNVQTRSLSPDTVYRYQVGSAANSTFTFWSSTFKFHTPSSQDHFKFLAFGDLVKVLSLSFSLIPSTNGFFLWTYRV